MAEKSMFAFIWQISDTMEKKKLVQEFALLTPLSNNSTDSITGKLPGYSLLYFTKPGLTS